MAMTDETQDRRVKAELQILSPVESSQALESVEFNLSNSQFIATTQVSIILLAVVKDQLAIPSSIGLLEHRLRP